MGRHITLLSLGKMKSEKIKMLKNTSAYSTSLAIPLSLAEGKSSCAMTI